MSRSTPSTARFLSCDAPSTAASMRSSNYCLELKKRTSRSLESESEVPGSRFQVPRSGSGSRFWFGFHVQGCRFWVPHPPRLSNQNLEPEPGTRTRTLNLEL